MTTSRKKSTKTDWFAVDKEGLASLLERRGKARSVLELVQNCWDEQGVQFVKVTLEAGQMRGRSVLIVEDDAPAGFADLSHAFTLFAPSAKVTSATKRGRFNLGEKLVLAICDEASVVSTTGGWVFDGTGRHERPVTRPAGSEFRAIIRLTAPERAEALDALRTLIPPQGIETTVNGELLKPRIPMTTFTATLRTEIADAEGVLRPTRRQTSIELHIPGPDEKPHLYEMGIPVVETGLPWHVNIGQKVPLNLERDNVTPAYSRELSVVVLNETSKDISPEQATSTWVKEAMSDERTGDGVIEDIVKARFGDKVVAYDLHDKEANAEAVLHGYTVVHGRTLSKDEWANVKRAGLILPAGQVTPSNATIELSPEGRPPIPESSWTPGMRMVGDYAKRLAVELLGVSISVTVTNVNQNFLAAYGSRGLIFNVGRLGHRWFNDPDQQAVDALLIHEFAHERVSNHLSEEFHTEVCRLGAKIRWAKSEISEDQA